MALHNPPTEYTKFVMPSSLSKNFTLIGIGLALAWFAFWTFAFVV
jgi:hypothetical protein